MVKHLRGIFVLALLAIMGQVSAQAVFTETFDQCSGAGGNDGGWSGVNPTADQFKADNDGWTGENGPYGASKCAKFGTGKNAGSATTPEITLTGNGVLTFKAGAWKGDGTSLALTAEGATLSESSVTMVNEAFTDYKVSITGATGTVKITFKATKRFFLDEVVVSVPSGKKDAGLAFGEKDYTTFMGESFTAPTLTNPNNLTVTYASSDEKVATVDATGKVTVVAPGTTTITASSAETADYDAGTASYKLTVGQVVNSISELKALGAKKVGKWTVKDAQVLFVNGKQDMYVRDATGAIDFFYTGLTYKIGDILNGTIVATYDEFNGLPEATAVSDNKLTVTEGTVTPTAKKASELTSADYCDLVKVTGAYVADKKTLDDVPVYDKFKTNVLTDKADGTYTVTAICVPFKDKPDLAIITMEVTSGINGIVSDKAAKNAPVYNLSGQRVDSSYKGVVIRNGKKFVNK